MTNAWNLLPGMIAVQTGPGPGALEWGTVVMGVTGIFLILVLAAIVLWQVFKTMQTRMTTQAAIARDQAFRELAERATAAQETIAADTARITPELTAISTRVAAIEKLLREVE
ncbi:MAG: hypothetical protein H0V24_03510 [Chloroflexia bacterium]|nr:hypothetical protein [Chloroflexia bacterium]